MILPPHVEFAGENETKDDRWSASFRYFELRCTLRERRQGAIQCKADWLPGQSGVRSTNTKLKSEAIVLGRGQDGRGACFEA